MTATSVTGPRVWAGEPLERHDPVPLPGFLLEHAKTGCEAGHWFTPPAASLVPYRLPNPATVLQEQLTP